MASVNTCCFNQKNEKAVILDLKVFNLIKKQKKELHQKEQEKNHNKSLESDTVSKSCDKCGKLNEDVGCVETNVVKYRIL